VLTYCGTGAAVPRLAGTEQAASRQLLVALLFDYYINHSDSTFTQIYSNMDQQIISSANVSNSSQKRPANEPAEQSRGKRAKYTSAAWYVALKWM
jgi:hypothetical protein